MMETKLKPRLAITPLEKLWAYLSNKHNQKMIFPSEKFMRDRIIMTIVQVTNA